MPYSSNNRDNSMTIRRRFPWIPSFAIGVACMFGLGWSYASTDASWEGIQRSCASFVWNDGNYYEVSIDGFFHCNYGFFPNQPQDITTAVEWEITGNSTYRYCSGDSTSCRFDEFPGCDDTTSAWIRVYSGATLLTYSEFDPEDIHLAAC